jgi:hypothetical protein
MNLAAIKHGGEACLVSGCKPSFNAYTRSVETGHPEYHKVRRAFAGMHFHVGFQQSVADNAKKKLGFTSTMELAAFLAKAMDRAVGIPSIVFTQDPSEVERRKYYGRAGSFRERHVEPDWNAKLWIFEYRTVGGWFLNNQYLCSLLLAGVQSVADNMTPTSEILKVSGLINAASDEDVQNAINNGDKALAEKIYLDCLKALGYMSDNSNCVYSHELLSGYSFWANPGEEFILRDKRYKFPWRRSCTWTAHYVDAIKFAINNTPLLGRDSDSFTHGGTNGWTNGFALKHVNEFATMLCTWDDVTGRNQDYIPEELSAFEIKNGPEVHKA